MGSGGVMARRLTDAEAEATIGMRPPPTPRVRITDEEAALQMSLSPTPPAEVRAKVKAANRERGLKPSAPQPSAVSSYARGVMVEGPAQAAGIAGTAFDALIGMGARIGLPAARHLQGVDFGGQMGGRAREALGRAVPIPAAEEGTSARVAEQGGAGTFVGALGAPFAYAGGLPLMAGEVVLSTLGAAAGEGVKQATESEGAGIGAELLASAGAPVVLGPKVVSKSPQIAAAAARLVRSMSPSKEALQYAEKLGVSVLDLHKAAGEFKTFVSEHPSGDERYIGDWIRYLDEAMERFGPDEVPTTRQIIEARRDAGSPLAALEEGLGGQSRGFGMKVLGRRQAAEDTLRAEVDKLRSGDPSELPGAYKKIRDMRWTAQKRQWDAIPEADRPVINTADLKASAQEAIDRAGEFEEDIPDEALKILEWPDEVTWDRFQAMRSRMLKSQRIGSRGTAETMSQLQVDNRAVLIDGFNREVSRLSETAGTHGRAYQDALRSTTLFYNDFSPTSVVTRSFEDMTEIAQITSRIRSSKRPAEEAARAVRIFAQDPGKLEAFRASVLNDVIGPGDLNPGMAKQSLKKLRANQNLIETVMGPSGYRHVEDVLERARMVSIGKTGKSAQAVSTGSGREAVKNVAAPMAAMIDPIGIGLPAAAKAVIDRLSKNPNHGRILREVMLDPALGSFLLKLPEPREVEAWVIGWNQMAARSGLRVASREASE